MTGRLIVDKVESPGDLTVTANGNDVVTVKSNGNVGIGTSSPEIKLDVRGALQSYGESGDSFNAAVSAVEYGTKSPYLSLYKTRGSKSSPTNTLPGDNIGFIYFGGYNSVIGGSDPAAYSSIRVVQMGDATANGTPHDLSFNVNSGSAQYGSERMRITSDGNVGIGTSSPGSKLTVAGSCQLDNTTINGGAHELNVSGTGDRNTFIDFHSSATTVDYNARILRNPGTNGVFLITNIGTGSIDVIANSGGVRLTNGATSWAAISDERLKTNLVEISDAISKVVSLRAVTGRYLEDEQDISRAFLIAQDVQKVLPEAVDVADDEDKTLSLRYTETIPLLTKAIQEQQAMIEELSAQVKSLLEAD